jgi:hypothetical protein
MREEWSCVTGERRRNRNVGIKERDTIATELDGGGDDFDDPLWFITFIFFLTQFNKCFYFFDIINKCVQTTHQTFYFDILIFLLTNFWYFNLYTLFCKKNKIHLFFGQDILSTLYIIINIIYNIIMSRKYNLVVIIGNFYKYYFLIFEYGILHSIKNKFWSKKKLIYMI